jgi:hypothetical protein
MRESYPPISLSNVRAIASALGDAASHPDELDDVTARMGIPPILVNPHLATQVDLSGIGLDKATYIPVQISTKLGGRKSLYFLRAGEKILSGIFVTSQGLGFRYTTRESGNTIPAQGGDRYTEEFRTADAKIVARLQGSLEVGDISRGEGRLVFDSGEPAPLEAAARRGRARTRCTWFAWSFYLECVETLTA